MGTRRQTISEFLHDQGFGQAEVPGVESFHEYPPHNALLQELAGRLGPQDPRVQGVAAMLLQARQRHELGDYAAESALLEQAYGQLERVSAGFGFFGMDRRTWLIVLMLAAAFAAIWWYSTRRNPRLPGRRRRRRKALPQPEDDEEDDDDEDEA